MEGYVRLRLPSICDIGESAREGAQRKIPPQWSLPLIVKVLLKPPFEPCQKFDLKHLMLTTVFLTALASGRRRSELHAPCFDSAHFRQNKDQLLVTLYPNIDFVTFWIRLWHQLSTGRWPQIQTSGKVTGDFVLHKLAKPDEIIKTKINAKFYNFIIISSIL